MSRIKFLTIGIGYLLALCVGCGSGDVSGPEQALKSFYDHLNSGEYSAALELYTAKARESLSDPDSDNTEGFAEWARSVTREGSLRRVQVVEQNSEGETTVLQFELVFSDGTTQRQKVSVVQENGSWKLGLIG